MKTLLSLFGVSSLLLAYFIVYLPEQNPNRHFDLKLWNPTDIAKPNHEPSTLRLDVGTIEPGSYHAYGKWEVQGESVAALDADFEIVSTEGQKIASFKTGDATPSFEVVSAEKGVVNFLIRDRLSIDGAVPVFVIARENPLIVGFLTFGSLIGLVVSTIGIVVALLLRWRNR